ncbi:MAG: hypothetical protein QOJ57_230, partial [Thermoleophilaceae bacterium]|nr:hypothetical protein [Thermoleophilaceae bacterium]
MLALTAAPAAAMAAGAVTKLPTTSETLSIPAASARSCASHQSADARGVSLRSYTAKADGAVTMRLRGGSRDNWDLALFDTASGRRLDA